jgi:hypothetical protein
MSTDTVDSEIRSFGEFLARRLDDPVLTPEGSVREFRAYQEELRRAQMELRESREEYSRGEAKPVGFALLMFLAVERRSQDRIVAAGQGQERTVANGFGHFFRISPLRPRLEQCTHLALTAGLITARHTRLRSLLPLTSQDPIFNRDRLPVDNLARSHRHPL